MKKGIQNKYVKLFISMLLNPIFIIAYCIFMYELSTLCKYGKSKENILVISSCMVFYIVWLGIYIFRCVRKVDKKQIDSSSSSSSNVIFNSFCKRVWMCVAIVAIAVVTIFYGYKIYDSSIKYNGKLSWFLDDLIHEKKIQFEHDNIYKDGIDGIFKDINKKVELPQKLYIADSFSLKFNAEGIITSFDTFIYGKDTKGKLRSFLINYDKNKSENIIVNLDGYVDEVYSEDMILRPLITTMNVIPLKETVNRWNESEYGILYYGKRSFGYNTDGIRYIDSNGNINSPSTAESEIIGYTVSVYVPGKEDIYTPIRYNFRVDLLENNKSDYFEAESGKEDVDETIAEEFILSEQVAYRLKITGAALGNRFYSLYGTFDGGKTWGPVSEDPFNGSSGGASGMTFINNKIGFLCLSHSGGSYADLYRTEDGGVTYEKVEFPEVKVPLGDVTFNPFDYPNMPYEEDGDINVLIGQGSDGDYNTNSQALYQSKDNGRTWTYIKGISGN